MAIDNNCAAAVFKNLFACSRQWSAL